MEYAITIKPQYVEAIRLRRKLYEIRTRVPRDLRQGDDIFVVEAGTGGEVMLHLRVVAVICNKPDVMYSSLGLYMAISKKNYDAYVDGREVVYAIAFYVWQEGKPLMKLADLGLKRAPQWFTKVSRNNGKG